ncbi:MAG TPA: NUDIX hydrolase [Candidatus Lumbricidophila sp.]|nr:NUDIX hydrolase [Candidatus Lumbricidophila sp.]
MTAEPSAPLESAGPPPHVGPRDPGDAWVYGPDGSKFWGAFGAAGLLAIDPARGVLLQHRVAWSHHGGTWGLPGGARHAGESAVHGALRESHEEAGVPAGAIRPLFTHLLDLEFWSYTTLVGEVTAPFDPTIGDAESLSFEWVPIPDVSSLPLHPGFEAAWPLLLHAAERPHPAVVVDVANVVGSVPNGWWRDRVGAASRLLERLGALAADGMPAAALERPWHTWFPDWVAVLEGQARAARTPAGIEVVRAEASGDDAIVEAAQRLTAQGREVAVITSDRGLIARVSAVGATRLPPRWVLDRLAQTSGPV